jgi:uncharacterized protein
VKDVLSKFTARRSIYALGKELPIQDAELRALVSRSLEVAPSAFNSQSARIVILEGEAHEALWEETKRILKPLTPSAEAYEKTVAKLDSFKAGRGTILYFEDQAVVKGLQESYPLYKDNFPVWSLESSGMLQYMVWTVLAEAGVGASLQHYNPLINEWVAKKVDAPPTWLLLGQMPYGGIAAPATPKESLPLEGRFKVVK